MKNRYALRYVGCAFIVFCIYILWKNHLDQYLTLDYIQNHQDIFKGFLIKHYTIACIMYVALYASLIICMLSLTLVLTVYGGFIFGTLPALLLSIMGALIGCTFLFLAIRYIFYQWLVNRHYTALEKFTKRFKKNGALYLLSLYFFPLTPFAFVTLLAALSDIPLKTFLWTTAVGIFPITALCSYAGKNLATVSSIHDLLSLPIVLTLIMLSLLTLTPLITMRKQDIHSL